MRGGGWYFPVVLGSKTQSTKEVLSITSLSALPPKVSAQGAGTSQEGSNTLQLEHSVNNFHTSITDTAEVSQPQHLKQLYNTLFKVSSENLTHAL